MADGIAAQGAAAGVKFATASEILDARTVTLAAEAAFQAQLGTRSTSLQTSLNQADTAGRKFIQDTKKVLAIPLGDDWSQGWAETGFLDANLKTPSKLVERETLLRSCSSTLPNIRSWKPWPKASPPHAPVNSTKP